MGQIQTLQESFFVFHLLILFFSPLLTFLYFEFVSKILKRDDDHDRGSGINVLAYQV